MTLELVVLITRDGYHINLNDNLYQFTFSYKSSMSNGAYYNFGENKVDGLAHMFIPYDSFSNEALKHYITTLSDFVPIKMLSSHEDEAGDSYKDKQPFIATEWKVEEKSDSTSLLKHH
jgi:hypothetical protein